MAMRWVFGLAEVNNRYVSSRNVWPMWDAVPWTTCQTRKKMEVQYIMTLAVSSVSSISRCCPPCNVVSLSIGKICHANILSPPSLPSTDDNRRAIYPLIKNGRTRSAENPKVCGFQRFLQKGHLTPCRYKTLRLV